MNPRHVGPTRQTPRVPLRHLGTPSPPESCDIVGARGQRNEEPLAWLRKHQIGSWNPETECASGKFPIVRRRGYSASTSDPAVGDGAWSETSDCGNSGVPACSPLSDFSYSSHADSMADASYVGPM